MRGSVPIRWCGRASRRRRSARRRRLPDRFRGGESAASAFGEQLPGVASDERCQLRFELADPWGLGRDLAHELASDPHARGLVGAGEAASDLPEPLIGCPGPGGISSSGQRSCRCQRRRCWSRVRVAIRSSRWSTRGYSRDTPEMCNSRFENTGCGRRAPSRDHARRHRGRLRHRGAERHGHPNGARHHRRLPVRGRAHNWLVRAALQSSRSQPDPGRSASRCHCRAWSPGSASTSVSSRGCP